MAFDATLAQRVGLALVRRRHALGLSQLEASICAEVGTASLSRWETGTQTPRLKSLWRVCERYAIAPAELLRLVEPPLPPGWPPEALDALRDSPELREAIATILKGDGEGGEP